ncbi:restriction endonuclease subunit S [Lacinutrix salivirga]
MSSVDEKLPDGWIETSLGEVVDITMGQSPKSEFYNKDGNGLPFYQGVTEFNDKYVSIKTYTSKVTKVVSENSILFSVRAPVGRVNFTKHKSCIGRGNAGMYMKNGNQDYLYFLLNHINRRLQDYSSGTVFTSISGKELNIIPVLIPNKVAEQKAIAKVLTAFDDKIENLRAQNQTLEQTAQTIFKEWFGKYQIDDELPDGWRVGKLGEVTKICGGTTPSTKNLNFWDGDIHWTSPKDLSNSRGMFLLSTEKKITKEGLKKISSGLLPKKTLLLSSRAPIGYLSFTNIELAINQGFIALLPNQYLSNEYMYLWLSKFMRVVENAGNGSTFLEISKTSFRNIDCIIPEEKVLNRFNNFINPTFDKILSNSKQIQTLTKTRDSLLPKLMRGEIRVNGFKK